MPLEQEYKGMRVNMVLSVKVVKIFLEIFFHFVISLNIFNSIHTLIVIALFWYDLVKSSFIIQVRK